MSILNSKCYIFCFETASRRIVLYGSIERGQTTCFRLKGINTSFVYCVIQTFTTYNKIAMILYLYIRHLGRQSIFFYIIFSMKDDIFCGISLRII